MKALNAATWQFPKTNEIAADLLETTPRQRFVTLARPFVALLVYTLVARAHGWALLPFVLFGVFICTVTATHDVVHGSLGLKRRQTEWALFLLGAILLESGHAYRATHLQHHRVFPDHNDIEGEPARMAVWQTLLYGPVYLPRLWWWAYRRSHRHPAQRAWLLAEAFIPFVALVSGVLLRHVAPELLLYVLLVITGSWVYPFVTAHLQHQVDGPSPLIQSHTLRGRIVSCLFLNLTYHLEHHLYPQVPSHHLDKLARQLDEPLRDAGVHIPQLF